jgi:capsular exopolysaccharide synthesis family protein
MVTSAVPGDGKTMTSLNLALVLSESYRRRVVLVEADFRRPRIGGVINLPMAEGLSDIMKSPEDRKVKPVQLTPYLTLVPAGRPDADPVSGLTSRRMQEFLLSAAEEFDWVILDTPPTSVAADAALLSPFTDATIMVIRAGHTPNAAVQQSIDAIGRERIVGVVLNAAPQPSATSGDYYGSIASEPYSGQRA